MALLRILIIFFYFIPLQTFAGETPSGTAPGAKATTSLEPIAEKIYDYAGSSAFGPYATQIQSTAAQIKSAAASCDSKKTIADWACLEKANSGIVKFVSEQGQLLSMGFMMGASLGEQCKGIGDLLSKANSLLGLFQAECSAAQGICGMSCKSVGGIARSTEAAVNTAVKNQCSFEYPDPNSIAACNAATEIAGLIKAELTKITKLTGEKMTVCGEYQINSTSAMTGAIMALQGYAKAKACENQNTNAPTPGMDCNDTQSPGYATINCQCARGEKSAAECQNINVNPALIKPGAISLPSVSSTGSGGGGPGGAELTDDTPDFKPQAATPGGAPPPVDGGGGGLDGGGGGNGSGTQDGASSPRRLNANILGGYGSGGGGGGGSAGPGYGEMDSKLKEYMPGAKKDPSRSLASQLAKEVTPQAGRSNWEKVRLRYRDNYSSLLNK